MRKNKILNVLIFTLLFLRLFSQNQTNRLPEGTGSNASDYNLPDVIPPSSESFSRTQFGNVPMSEFRGTQNLSLPIYTLKQGDITVPITLNYSKLGLKVNDIPNNVGMSWVLETGGVINRTINSWPDELAVERKYYESASELLSLNTNDGTADANELNRLITRGDIDLEVDIFNFTYPGNSGSFYLDKNLNPVLITDDKSCKIEFNNNFNDTYQFIITDNKGIKYYFGGETAKEETGNKLDYSKRAVTSFYLSKIIDTKGNVINYTYSVANARSYTPEKIQKQLVYYTDNVSCPQFGRPTGVTEEIFNFFTIKTPVVLNKISTDTQEIIFESTPSKPAVSKLNKIQIFYKEQKKQEIRFSYISQSFVGDEERFFLNKVESFAIKDNNETKKDEFLLEYDDPLAIPNRLSYSIDYLGYYNGANNNDLLPDTDLFQNTTIVPFLGQQIKIKGRSNRKPNFNFAKKGTLKSITYPTKGKTVFEYESNKAKKKKYLRTLPSAFENDYSVYPINPITYVDFNGSEIISDTVKFHIEMSSAPGNTLKKGVFKFEIINRDTNVSLFSDIYTIPRTVDELEKSIIFNTQSGINYRARLSIGEYCNECGGSFLADVGTTISWEEEEDFGLRLKRQYDYTENTDANIKRYYYSDYENINNVTALQDFYKPSFVSTKVETTTTSISTCSTDLLTASSILYYINSAPNQTVLAEEDIDIKSMIYPNVTISYGGENFEKGGEEKKFEYGNINTMGVLVYPSDFEPNSSYTNQDFSPIINTLEQIIDEKKQFFNNYNGRLVKNTIFRKLGNNLFLERIINNNYSKKTNKEIFNLVGTKVFEKLSYPSGVLPGTTTSNLFIGFYPLASYYGNIESTSVKDYIDSVPINVQDDSLYKKIITTTNYYYNQPNHNQLTTEESSLPDGTTIKKQINYAYEKGNQKLIDANMVGIPLETVNIKNGKTVSKVETLYPTSLPTTQTGNLLLPLSVQSTRTNTISLSTPPTGETKDTELTYDKYDDKGNIVQYSEKGLKPTVIIWGYNKTQPIAKIEGAKYDDIKTLQVVLDAITASDTDATQGTASSEQSLLTALDNLRINSSFSNYTITTYSYDPLIGVTSITPPSGIREIYKYDTANRLQSVVDVNGKILKEYQYNYKQ